MNKVKKTAFSEKMKCYACGGLMEEGVELIIGVKISIPDVSEKNINQLYRALFYYLKAKFESLTFGFVEEYNEAFVKEFMEYSKSNIIPLPTLSDYRQTRENCK